MGKRLGCRGRQVVQRAPQVRERVLNFILCMIGNQSFFSLVISIAIIFNSNSRIKGCQLHNLLNNSPSLSFASHAVLLSEAACVCLRKYSRHKPANL